MLKEEKLAIIEKYAIHEGDTGSPEVQIALLTRESTTSQITFVFTRRIITLAAAS